MCFCLITICFHMPNVFYLFVALLLTCQRWPIIGLIKVFYSILFVFPDRDVANMLSLRNLGTCF